MHIMPLYSGPKMYLGQASISSNIHLSSTKLHMDITDAYNLLLFAAKCPDGTPGYAVWYLFRAEDACLLRKFTVEECGFQGPEDSIHSQSINLTPDLLERFFNKYDVRPVTIHQYPGDIVLIPAYCAHQVYPLCFVYIVVSSPSDYTLMQVANRADCIKVASDFLSVDNLKRTERLVGELRMQRLAAAHGDDVLAFYVTLWYAWQSLSSQLQELSGGSLDSVWTSTPFTGANMPPPMDVDISPMVPTISTHSMQKSRRDRAYRKKRRNIDDQEKRKGPAFLFACPHFICDGKMLTRSGYIDHM
jgi:hypothetical protein